MPSTVSELFAKTQPSTSDRLGSCPLEPIMETSCPAASLRTRNHLPAGIIGCGHNSDGIAAIVLLYIEALPWSDSALWTIGNGNKRSSLKRRRERLLSSRKSEDKGRHVRVVQPYGSAQNASEAKVGLPSRVCGMIGRLMLNLRPRCSRLPLTCALLSQFRRFTLEHWIPSFPHPARSGRP